MATGYFEASVGTCAVVGNGSLILSSLGVIASQLQIRAIASSEPAVKTWAADRDQAAQDKAAQDKAVQDKAAQTHAVTLPDIPSIALFDSPEALAAELALGQSNLDYLIWLEERQLPSLELQDQFNQGTLLYRNALPHQTSGYCAAAFALMQRARQQQAKLQSVQLQQTQMFGISWIWLERGEPEPSVIKVSPWEIAEDDTAIQLSLKGYETAIAGLPDVLSQLAMAAPNSTSASSRPVKPEVDSEPDTDAGADPKSDRPAVTVAPLLSLQPTADDEIWQDPALASGLLHWEQPAAVLEAQVRACNFGPQAANPVTMAKLILRQPAAIRNSSSDFRWFAVSQLTRLPQAAEQEPGQLIAAGLGGLKVATSTEVVLLQKFMTMDGQPLASDTLLAWAGLQVGDCLPMLTPEQIQTIAERALETREEEGAWRSRLSQLVPLMPEAVFPGQPSGSANSTTGIDENLAENSSAQLALDACLDSPLQPRVCSLALQSWAIPGVVTRQINQVIQRTQEPQRDFILLAFVAFLARLSGQGEFDLAWQDEVVTALQAQTWGNQVAQLPCRFQVDVLQPVTAVHAALQDQLDQIRTLGSYRQDIVLRYPELRSRLAQGDRLELYLGIGQSQAGSDDIPALPAQLVLLQQSPEQCCWHYDQQRFSPEQIQQLQSRFSAFLLAWGEALAQGSEHSLAALPIFDQAEYQCLVVERNQTQRDWNIELPVSQLFEAQAAKTPETIALVYGEQSITYDQLNRRVNQLAHHLIDQGIEPEDLVGLCLDRSFEMVIGMLAIHKAGGAYLPLDPNYPAERLSLIVEDAQPKLLLTQQNNVDCLPELGLPTVWMDRDAEMLATLPEHNPVLRAKAENLAYLIYTSGSTGKPKGVMIEHRSLSNFCRAVQEFYDVGTGDRVLQFSTINFDLSVEQFYPYLTCGGSLALRTPDMTESIPHFLRCCERWGVTVLDLPTAYWNLLVVEMVTGNYALPSSIRRAVIIGEPASPERVAQWQRLSAGRAQLVNSYGPTEATVAATRYFVPNEPTPTDVASPHVSIGLPMGNMQVYLLDRNQQLVPDGSIGEICIGGVGVARGYLNRPEINAERFIPDLFSGVPEARLYRTGDLGCYRADGNLNCLGRMDNQVKLRGYRIELGEIETCLNQHPAVKQAVVIVRESTPGNKSLVAYWVAKPERAAKQQVEAAELSQWVADQLPDYMVPAAIVNLEQLPLNANGKVDRKALPAPVLDSATAEARSLTALEQQLAQLWAELLGVDGLQAQSNYFEVGGNSLSALRLLVQLEKRFDVKLTISDLFQTPTLEALARRLGGETASSMAAAGTTLMQLKPTGSKRPFFFINSISFGMLLAPHFGEEYPFHCINIFGATERLLALGSDSGALSLRAMAESCVADMRAVQPHGPYLLGGYCDNSKLAFEMAQYLQEQGETVALLAFIDATWEVELNTWRSHLNNLRYFGPTYIGEKLRTKFKTVKEKALINWQRWQSWQQQSQGEGSTAVGRDILLLQQYDAATAAHQPQVFQGAIDCFLCSEMRSTTVPLVEPVASDGVRIHGLTGYHHTLFELPHVENLARQLEAAMERAVAGGEVKPVR